MLFLSASGLNGQPLSTAPATETLARIHWLGLNRISADTNSAHFMSVWRLPQTAALVAQTLDKFSRWPGDGATNAAGARLRPLLGDLVADESYLEIRQTANQPAECALAIRLADRRAAFWQTNLAAALNLLTGIPPVPAPEGHYGWSLRKHHPPNVIELTRMGGWTIVGAAEDFNGLVSELRIRTQRALPPWNLRNPGDWLEADLDPTRLVSSLTNAGSGAVWWGKATDEPASVRQGGAATAARTLTPPKLAKRIILNSQPPSNHRCGRGWQCSHPRHIRFFPAAGFAAVAWEIPTNFIRGPLTGFSAVRGFAPWLAAMPAWQKLELTPPPDQMYFWAQEGTPFQTWFAAPLPGASNQIWQLADRLVQKANPWLATNGEGYFQWTTNPPGLVWKSALLFSPVLKPIIVDHHDYVLGGLIPFVEGNPNPPPAEFLRVLLGTPGLVYFQFEQTGIRIEDDLFNLQLFRLVFHKSQLPVPAPPPCG